MIKMVYTMRKEIDNNGITIGHATSIIHKETKMNEGCASNYLNNLRCFKIGQVFAIKMNPEDSLYFLSQIYNDFDGNIYKNSLSALEQHIDYVCYELGEKSKNEKLLIDIYANKIKINEIVSWYNRNNDDYPLDNINIKNWVSRRDVTLSFSLDSAGQYLKEKGFGDIYDEAMKIYNPNANREAAIRRIYLICFLEEKKLLFDFWPEGKTAGKDYIQYVTENYKSLSDVKKIAFKFSDKKQIQKQTNNFQPTRNEIITKPVVLIKNSHASNNVNSFDATLNGEFLSDYYSWIAEKARTLFIQINEYRKENRKQIIFKEVDSVKLWSGIEKLYKHSETFGKFSDSLHGLFLENARDSIDRGKYKSRFPDCFVKNGTWTKEYIDDIKITRNKFAHNKSRDEIPEEIDWGMKRTILDVYEKYLGTKHIPETIGDFQELQIGIMTQFRNVLRKLLEIVKKE